MAEKTAQKKTEVDPYSKGVVRIEELSFGTKDSDSVRKLQTVLGIEVTGEYGPVTMGIVREWQNTHGFQGGRGIKVGAPQAEKLFGTGYTLK